MPDSLRMILGVLCSLASCLGGLSRTASAAEGPPPAPAADADARAQVQAMLGGLASRPGVCLFVGDRAAPAIARGRLFLTASDGTARRLAAP